MSDKVDCFYVGSMRSGSTWLHSVLSNNSSVSVHREKEVYFFDRQFCWDKISNYENGFDGLSSKVGLDISPTYCEDLKSIDRIFAYNPYAKVVFVYRDHVDLVFSQYKYMLSNGCSDQNFDDFWVSFRKEKFLFYPYLRTCIERFGRDNVLVLEFDGNNLENQLYAIIDFLGLENFEFDGSEILEQVNTSNRMPRNYRFYSWARKLAKVLVPIVGLRAVRSLRSKFDSYFRTESLSIRLDAEQKDRILKYYSTDRSKIVSLIKGG